MTALSISGLRLTAVPPVTSIFCRKPAPFMPGLQTTSYEPALTSAVMVALVPGPMFSRSATIRSSGKRT